MVEEQFETERKFLVSDPSIVTGHEGDLYRQAYLYRVNSPGRFGGHEGRIRLVRRKTAPGSYEDLIPKLTVKGPGKATRPEYELDIPMSYAVELFEDVSSRIEKTRYSIVASVPWEIDVFEGSNKGLVLAEYEASDAALLRPSDFPFLGAEVTGDRRYRNEYLADHPWPGWPENLHLET